MENLVINVATIYISTLSITVGTIAVLWSMSKSKEFKKREEGHLIDVLGFRI